jgi:hypothetical protein
LEMDMGSTDHPEDEEVQPDVSLSSLSTTQLSLNITMANPY